MILEAALSLVCQFSQPLCDTARNVPIIEAQHYPGDRMVAYGWADTGHIWYVPQGTRNPGLSDADEQFLIVVKETIQVQEARVAPFSGTNCQQQETAGHEVLAKAWAWLWYDQPPRTAYNGLEEAAVIDSTPGGIGIQANVNYTCAHLFD